MDKDFEQGRLTGRSEMRVAICRVIDGLKAEAEGRYGVTQAGTYLTILMSRIYDDRLLALRDLEHPPELLEEIG